MSTLSPNARKTLFALKEAMRSLEKDILSTATIRHSTKVIQTCLAYIKAHPLWFKKALKREFNWVLLQLWDEAYRSDMYDNHIVLEAVIEICGNLVDGAKTRVLLACVRNASNAKSVNSLRAVETRFAELYVKCNYLSVYCMNIRDVFIRACHNATGRLMELPTR